MSNKKKTELTEEEKYELELQAEAELGRLQRTYTILERDSGEGGADAGGKLAKLRKVLGIFKKEQKNLLTDLTVATAEGKIRDDERKFKKLRELLKEYSEFDNEIKTQKAHSKEIDGQIKIVNKRVLELGAQIITDQKYLDRTLKGEKTLQTLENKLEVQTRKFCTICTENIKLREEINHLLIERFKFNKIWDKLINNLCVGKKFMLDLIEQATIAYDRREEWVSKLQSLRAKAYQDLLIHVQEMRTLQRKSDDDQKLKEFFSVKGQKRIMKDLEEKEMKKRQANRENMQAKLTKYLEIMVAIKEFSGQNLVEDVAKNFLDQEEENFAMFKYVNHLNEEMEEVSDRLGYLHVQIDNRLALAEFWRNQQADTLNELREKYEDATKQANDKEAELKTVEQKLEKIMTGVGKLFGLFRCKNDPLIQLLGLNENIHYYNVRLYMEILEQNIQRALVSVFHKEKALLEKRKMKQDQVTISELKGPLIMETMERIVATNPCPLCVEHELVSDVIDELQFAYDKGKIQEKLSARLKLEGAAERLHNVSACHLPKSRQIIQKRYQ